MTTKNDEKGWLQSNLEDSEFQRLYAREDFIEGFLHHLDAAMDDRGISRKQLAAIVGCSPANVTRALRRTSNLTATTMVDLALAAGIRLRIQTEPVESWLVGSYLNNVAGSSDTSRAIDVEERPGWKWPDCARLIMKNAPRRLANYDLKVAG